MGKASVRIAVEFAISIAPPTPCTTRQAISHSAPADPRHGVSASPIDATLNSRRVPDPACRALLGDAMRALAEVPALVGCLRAGQDQAAARGPARAEPWARGSTGTGG
ncbi:hypothetical protein FRACA_730023 [Frankia canadensis]|uniref:Uncharacterized protein n=1 Tax=Frankia canadensis TaxID=1836972 RepID=A0A2I2L0V7_9ACTN|nr:hypothetical protein FRACA_730023 [Frankia canadensis]SOU58834.1 hypothetical protein FRACA_730023 [Frankia canadensis]